MNNPKSLIWIIVSAIVFTISKNNIIANDSCMARAIDIVAYLPSNMRFVVQRIEQDELYLYDPQTGNEQAIPNTTSSPIYLEAPAIPAFPILFDQSQRLLVIRYTSNNDSVWQTMNLDGSNPVDVYETSASIGSVRLVDESHIFFSSTSGYGILNLNDGAYQTFLVPELENSMVPAIYAINPSLSSITYWSNSNDVSEVPILQIYQIETNRYIALEIEYSDFNYRPFFDWHNNSERLTVYPWDSTNALIFDANNGEMVLDIESPSDSEGSQPSETTWSPDMHLIAIRYASREYSTDESQEKFISIYDVLNNQHLLCFNVENPLPLTNEDKIFWTPDGNFLWWLECNADCQSSEDELPKFDLIVADVSAGVYGLALSDVGLYTNIGFMPDPNIEGD